MTGGKTAQNKVQKNDLGTFDLSICSETTEIINTAPIMAVKAIVSINAT